MPLTFHNLKLLTITINHLLQTTIDQRNVQQSQVLTILLVVQDCVHVSQILGDSLVNHLGTLVFAILGSEQHLRRESLVNLSNTLYLINGQVQSLGLLSKSTSLWISSSRISPRPAHLGQLPSGWLKEKLSA